MSDNHETHGWDSITAVFNKKYPNQQEPVHFGTLISWRLGGNDPLDGISVYDGGEYYHFVTYGFSELYGKESENLEYSGYGFELTIKLKKTPHIDDNELQCMAGILQSLARYIFESNAYFGPYEYIYTGQENGMDSEGASNLTGFITVPDQAGVIHTPNGKLEFIQLIGMTNQELKTIVNKEYTVEDLISKLENDLTDYERRDIV